MRHRLCISLCMAVSALIGSNAGAGVTPQPLSQVVRPDVRDCAVADKTQVPLITWGGDMATTYANGNNKQTTQTSVLGSFGLSMKMVREDVFPKQVEDYLKCKSPYLRGTIGMLNMASEVTNRDPRTAMVFVYLMTRSSGGDMLVVRDMIAKPNDLRGKVIAVQSYGPHVDYLARVLKDAGLSLGDVTIRWTKDLAGLSGDTPGKVFHDDPSVAAAFVISLDGLALTTRGTVGAAGEDSVRGARILLSTKIADGIIMDVYAVRADYFQAHRESVKKFVHGLMVANERLADLTKNKNSRGAEYQQMISAAADILLDSPQATADAADMYGDAKFVGWKGNVKFFGDNNEPRNFARLNDEIQVALVSLGLLSGPVAHNHARWDYNSFKEGLQDTSGVEAPRFDVAKVAQVVRQRQEQGTLDKDALFSLEIHFKPNQTVFDATLYEKDFDRVIELAATYGGAIITVEGNTDPLEYLRSKKNGKSDLVLKKLAQSALNLSMSRANAVRNGVVAYAQSKGIALDPTQFSVVGRGISKPKTGMCGADPCAPKTEKEWLNNMRVEFQLQVVETESADFKPL